MNAHRETDSWHGCCELQRLSSASELTLYSLEFFHVMHLNYLSTETTAEVISMQRLWNQAPQHPQKASTKVMIPAARQRESAEMTEYWCSSEAYPP
ncbi:hypothetical protein E2C01_043379 [Portunus trituberculatus]|uniref:Uncharacterized protein n=1 Tax=Portunus trituberculatus TaxID=210409 RepID=A0A5B7FST0_PORTR|nr:hypothetical protein [Portunus trituberculatus]